MFVRIELFTCFLPAYVNYICVMNISLLKLLCEIPATSGDEGKMKNFILEYMQTNADKWHKKPVIIQDDGFQDNLMFVFGEPKVALYAHMDSVGFTARYQNQLVSVGSPEPQNGDSLVGKDALGLIECNIQVDDNGNAYHNFARPIDRGTLLTYKPNFTQQGDLVRSQSLDNRVGVFMLLELAKTMEDGVLVFSTYEEHGGGSVGYLASHLYHTFGITNNLIVDVTWNTDGVFLGHGPVVSLRDAYIPRKKFINKIVAFLDSHSLVYQKEVEEKGGSDGSELQRSPLPLDWCFLGVAVHNPHSSYEEANLFDIVRLHSLLVVLLKHFNTDF